MDHHVEVDVPSRKHSKLSVVRSLALSNCDREGIVLARKRVERHRFIRERESVIVNHAFPHASSVHVCICCMTEHDIRVTLPVADWVDTCFERDVGGGTFVEHAHIFSRTTQHRDAVLSNIFSRNRGPHI